MWHVPIVDMSNKSGSLEFNITQKSTDAFFPISVGFTSQTLFCNVEPEAVVSTDTQLPIMYGASKVMIADEYTIE